MSSRRELQYVCCIKKVVWDKGIDQLFEMLTWVKVIVHRNDPPVALYFLSIPKHKKHDIEAVLCSKYLEWLASTIKEENEHLKL